MNRAIHVLVLVMLAHPGLGQNTSPVVGPGQPPAPAPSCQPEVLQPGTCRCGDTYCPEVLMKSMGMLQARTLT
jgi:hypothetical protein